MLDVLRGITTNLACLLCEKCSFCVLALCQVQCSCACVWEVQCCAYCVRSTCEKCSGSVLYCVRGAVLVCLLYEKCSICVLAVWEVHCLVWEVQCMIFSWECPESNCPLVDFSKECGGVFCRLIVHGLFIPRNVVECSADSMASLLWWFRKFCLWSVMLIKS